MKGFFIDKGTEVTVYRGGFDIETWMVKYPKSFKRHVTRKDLFIELSDCNVVDDGHGEPVLLANEAGFGLTVHLKRSGVESSWYREDRIYS
jgi:hypothetical protein